MPLNFSVPYLYTAVLFLLRDNCSVAYQINNVVLYVSINQSRIDHRILHIHSPVPKVSNMIKQ